jgi:hypothetical protein
VSGALEALLLYYSEYQAIHFSVRSECNCLTAEIGC